MPAPALSANPQPVLELLTAFRRSKTMFAAVKLGVFDALADGPASLETLTTRLGLHASALPRFLNALVGMGLLEHRGEDYVNSPAAEAFLTSRSPQRLTGYLTMAACQRYPELTGCVFDLPEATPLARQMIAASPVADRVSVQDGDFFQDELPSADLYALGRIIHDWSEEKSHRLLQKIHTALPTGGALLIAEKLLQEDHLGPDWAQMQDLNMLVCTEGRERTLSEYRKLLTSAGFSQVTGQVTTSPADAILAVK